MVLHAAVVGGVAAASLVAGATTACAIYCEEREKLKNFDKEIKMEREREREKETILENQKRSWKSLKHFTHTHELFEVNSQSFSIEPDCEICHRPITRGAAYSCQPCNYHIHQVCATSLVALSSCSACRAKEAEPSAVQTTISTFAHPTHKVKDIHSQIPFTCHHCCNTGRGRRFRCESCQLDFHPVCALSPTKISSFMHPEHDLELVTRKHFSVCSICRQKEKSNMRMYRCKACRFYVHPDCSELPQHLVHDAHPSHPLILRPGTSTRKCDAVCGSTCLKDRWCYECQTCNIRIHIQCILKHANLGKSMKEDRTEILQVFANAKNAADAVANIANTAAAFI